MPHFVGDMIVKSLRYLPHTQGVNIVSITSMEAVAISLQDMTFVIHDTPVNHRRRVLSEHHLGHGRWTGAVICHSSCLFFNPNSSHRKRNRAFLASLGAFTCTEIASVAGFSPIVPLQHTPDNT